MKLLLSKPLFYLTTFMGAAVGLSIPYTFIILDLKQLSLQFNFANMYEIFKSQNIYVFSTVLFPLLFSAVGGLYFFISTQNKKLAEQKTYINNILNSLIDCILVCNNVGVVQYANKAYYENEVVGKNSLVDILGTNNLSSVALGQFFEVSLKNHKGEKRSVSYIVYRLNNEVTSRESDFFIVSIRDIEELKKNEEIIACQKEQLFEASKLSALGEMASGFAHEINNPLAIIKGKMTLTERELKKEELNRETILKNIETCKVTVDRITKIVVGLRNLAHSSNNIESEETSIKDLVEDPITMANLKMSGKGIHFTTEVAAFELETLFCNRIQISQVLMNILGNAIDAIEGMENPWLKLSVDVNEFGIKFTITDSGSGIPYEVQKKMFDPMFTTKPVGKGTGLGLSITRAIIEKHNGKIQINNECPNTCFEIYLPRATHKLAVAKVA